MSVKVNVPEVGESISEVTIASWLKEDGDFVEQDEIIAELESDKATFELPAETAGKLIIKAEEGDTLEVGALICEIDDSVSGDDQKDDSGKKEESKKDESSSSDEKADSSEDASPKSEPEKTGEIKEMVVPSVGESITEVTISSWLKEDGDYVELDEIIAEVESDKATFELPAEASGNLQIIAQEGDTLEIGATICKIEVMEGGKPSASESSADKKDEKTEDSEEEKSYAAGHASPAAAKILKEKGIDPSDIKGSGVDGRITKADAEAASKQEKQDKTTKQEPKKEESSQPPATSGERNERREKMTTLRKTI
ncbi:MAG: E3 binding domain-containing protein, partial [Cyclobacteriaceae bacterium]